MSLHQSLAIAFPAIFPILLFVGAVASSVGFIRFVYFISIGYGFAISAISLFLMLFYSSTLSIQALIIGLLLFLYGGRLSGFLLFREYSLASYKQEAKEVHETGKGMPVLLKICIWIACAFLYVCQTTPLFYRILTEKNLWGSNGLKSFSLPALLGIATMISGLCLETAADYQKAKSKVKYPSTFCSTGLYAKVRYPNYLAEIVFWLGAAISGLDIYSGIFQWVVVLFGFFCICFIMLGGARRLEIKQEKRYGNNPDFKAYAEGTPILFPMIPLYTLKPYSWLK